VTKAEHVGMSKKVLADALNRHLDVQACLIEGIIRRIDVNGDGVIDEDEVRQAMIPLLSLNYYPLTGLLSRAVW
jgi:hypothetical protein